MDFSLVIFSQFVKKYNSLKGFHLTRRKTKVLETPKSKTVMK